MNDLLGEFRLGPPALKYIRERLAQGKTLARYLLQRGDLLGGSVITYLPVGLPVEVMEDFATGGKLKRDPKDFKYWQKGGRSFRAEPVPDTDPWLASVLQEFLQGQAETICIFENSSALPTYPWLESSDVRTLIFDDEVYHLLSSGDAEDENKILATIRKAKSWLFYGVMTSSPKTSALSSRMGTIDREFLQTCALRAQKIVVGVYDGESHLIWSKPA